MSGTPESDWWSAKWTTASALPRPGARDAGEVKGEEGHAPLAQMDGRTRPAAEPRRGMRRNETETQGTWARFSFP
ncbi:hypothetical protein SKAU_G00394120 [Synaphobranchus kaupii]|uniref:Uncharacterized protein n=1 Tax=Synaphobranchus kaupii TaxID=118154 RepID=A0A9Q1EC41_SYNKA|nr:hypothetical protein SKAU_G00394120 [Synaphobranchus kaupii]